MKKPMPGQAARDRRRAEKKLRKATVAAGGPGGSPLAQFVQPPSRTPPAADFGLVEQFDNFARVRNGLRKVAVLRDQWAGIPMPIDGERLVINPKFPNAEALAEIGTPKREDDDLDGAVLRNKFYSRRLRCNVLIWQERDGRIAWGVLPAFHHLSHDLSTLACSVAWGIEQEHNALNLLGTLVRHHQMKQYLLTGMFAERSKRSGLSYLFRRLKPTVVINAKDGRTPTVMCTLCLHPIAYYAGSWAGAMCPTDDVVAHLMLMRGDEPMFWRRANQCPPSRPEAGL